jgi:two-component system chemotaxis response regulator CheY
MTESLPYKVLIVDDHAMARQIVYIAMQELNVAQIEMAANGKEARDALYKAYDIGVPFDVVFLDWDMPVIEGIDVLKHFRTHPEFANTIFIMITAAAEQKEVLEAVKSGANGYIVKPVSKESVSKKFLELMEKIKAQKIANKLSPASKRT